MKPYIFRLAWIYLSTPKDNRFINVISLISIFGILLGVMVLITILSIMNGFQSELRDRVLGMTSHMTLFEKNYRLKNWQEVRESVLLNDEVIAVAPNVNKQALVSYGSKVKGILVKGIEPKLERGVSKLTDYVDEKLLDRLEPNTFRIILGEYLAQEMRVTKGDKVTLIAPQMGGGIVGNLPRLRRFEVIGTVSVGVHEYDSAFALIHLQDAAKFYRMGEDVSQVQIKTKDLFKVNEVTKSLSSVLRGGNESYYVLTWQQQNANFFQAIQLEKRIMSIIIALIIAVAAFNIVSTMVMVVNEKKSAIAILRTQGATQKDMVILFFTQGVMIGLMGTLAGVFLGVVVSLNIDVIVPVIESFFEIQFFPSEFYYISVVPSDLHVEDVLWVAGFSLVSSIFATLYPSWHASRVQPSEILRYE